MEVGTVKSKENGKTVESVWYKNKDKKVNFQSIFMIKLIFFTLKKMILYVKLT